MGTTALKPRVITFHHCVNIPEKISFKEERFILAQGFRGSNPWSLGSVVSGPVVRQNIMAGSTW
jgi:hypothetical protein